MNLAKNIEQVLSQNYTIPLYQRNYNWGNNEITSFLQDIYHAFRTNPLQNYYIGSLIVFRGKYGTERFEVIDGQQRLTTIHLIARFLSIGNLTIGKLKYDSRRDVEAFFNGLEKGHIAFSALDKENKNLENLIHAFEIIGNVNLEGTYDSTISLSAMKLNGNLADFSAYFFKHVMLVEVEMPSDTDVASYFEIMNNRGKQLQEHEILKAHIMAKITESNHRVVFGKIWDACSEMNAPIQKFFNSDQREKLFGKMYDEFYPNNIEHLVYEDLGEHSFSLVDMLEDKSFGPSSQEEQNNETEEEYDSLPIIDFPNFLIHVLKLTYRNTDIPLSSDKLMRIYKSIPMSEITSVSPMEFLKRLLFYRVVFDRFVVKSEYGIEDDDQEDKILDSSAGFSRSRWKLKKPIMKLVNNKYRGKKYPSLSFQNTFEDRYQERMIKLLTMLQVTYRQRKNKNYLQYILGLFDPSRPQSLKITAQEFLKKVESFTLRQFGNLNISESSDDGIDSASKSINLYAQGTNTPHFVFNFIDYLLWVDSVVNKVDHGINQNFDFVYLNSIEHHYPQVLLEHLANSIVIEKKVTLNCLHRPEHADPLIPDLV
ncbi:DUF262 domain-containing protein [Sphingobacterium siyangense]|uniref:DUF262 domain-containing protein n=1 Tax=Sphingobacterium siyangense TaxID=459529 RepID=UPI003DA66DC7